LFLFPLTFRKKNVFKDQSSDETNTGPYRSINGTIHYTSLVCKCARFYSQQICQYMSTDQLKMAAQPTYET
jgi:hypothetical protein